MLWQVLNLRRYFVWVCQDCLVNHVKQKGFQLIALMSMVSKFINAGIMDHRTKIFMALEIEQIEEVIINQVIQMRRRLNLLQV